MDIKPQYLPNLDTVKDILLDLEDTGLYNIEYSPVTLSISPNTIITSEYVYKYELGKKVVKYFEVDNESINFSFSESGVNTNNSILVIENEFEVIRYMKYINILYNINTYNHYELNEVIERIKTYLGEDFVEILDVMSSTSGKKIISICVILHNVNRIS